MKNRLAVVLIILCFYVNAFSQQVSFPITYDLNLNIIKDKNDHRNNPAETLYEEGFWDADGKRKANTLTHTKFYPDKMEELLTYFVKHIEANKIVKNYTENAYYSGIWQLSKEYIKKLNDPNQYKKWGGYYLSLESNNMVWENGTAKGSNGFGEVKVDYNGTFTKELVQMMYPFPPYDYHDTLLYLSNGLETFSGLGFLEFWNFDDQKGSFTKDVQMLSMNEFKLDNNTGELRGIYTPLIFKSTSKIDSTYIFKKNMKYDVFFDTWNSCNIYKTDGSCENLKNEVGSGTSTRNAIPSLYRAQLFMSIMKAIEAGTLIAMDPTSYEKKEERKLSLAQVYDCLSTTDTSIVQYPYPPYDEYWAIYTTSVSMEEFIGIRFIEDWSFDPIAFNFYKKVKAFAILSTNVQRNTGELLGYKTLLYLKAKND